jgi:hypothetical protein
VVGIVLGTARYMSPEQVMGEDVDGRTDVWAFGCVLYEMLTGRPAFPGRSVSEAVAAVLRDDPDWRALPTEAPPGIVRLLRRSLRRNRQDRLQHIGDARLELVEVDVEGAASAGQGRLRRSVPVALLLTLALLTIAGATTFFLMRTPQSTTAAPPAARLSLELPAGLTLTSEYSAPFAIAPAGSPLVLEANEGTQSRLYVRELSEPLLRSLVGTEGARQPVVSNDGAWVAFFANRKLWKIPTAGGAIVELADIGDNPRGAAWAPDGTIIVAPTQTSGLVRLLARGGKPEPLTTVDLSRGEYSHRWPAVLPGGKWAIFTVGLDDAMFDEGRIEAVSLETGERRMLVTGAGFARYERSGQLLFVRGGQLHAVDFDADSVGVRGTPEVVLDGIRYDARNGGTHLAVSDSGVLVYSPGLPRSSEYYLTWVDRDGQLRRAVDTPRRFRDPRASPDGKRVAVVIGASTQSDLWLLDANGTLSRLSFDVSPHRPTWTHDGAQITVGAEKSGKWRLLTTPANGTGEPIVLHEASHRMYPSAWTSDGRHLIFQQRRPQTGWDLYSLQVDTSGRPVGAPQAFATTPSHESNAALSRDGRWLAYESDEVDGVVQVYVRSFPDGGHKVRASTGGARWPVWDIKGNLHFWQTGENMMLSARTHLANGQLVIDAPQPAWPGDIGAEALTRAVISTAGARYDFDPTGNRFLVLESAADDSRPQLAQPIIVLGWLPGPVRSRS